MTARRRRRVQSGGIYSKDEIELKPLKSENEFVCRVCVCAEIKCVAVFLAHAKPLVKCRLCPVAGSGYITIHLTGSKIISRAWEQTIAKISGGGNQNTKSKSKDFILRRNRGSWCVERWSLPNLLHSVDVTWKLVVICFGNAFKQWAPAVWRYCLVSRIGPLPPLHVSMYHSIPSIVDVTICHVIYFHSALTTQSASAWGCSCVPQIAPYHHVTISRRVFQLKATTWKKYTNTNTKTQLQKMHKYLNTHIQIQNNSTPCFQSHIHHIEKIPKYKNTDCTISFPQWIEAQGHHVEKVRDRLLTHYPTTKLPKYKYKYI